MKYFSKYFYRRKVAHSSEGVATTSDCFVTVAIGQQIEQTSLGAPLQHMPAVASAIVIFECHLPFAVFSVA